MGLSWGHWTLHAWLAVGESEVKWPKIITCSENILFLVWRWGSHCFSFEFLDYTYTQILSRSYLEHHDYPLEIYIYYTHSGCFGQLVFIEVQYELIIDSIVLCWELWMWYTVESSLFVGDQCSWLLWVALGHEFTSPWTCT